MSPQTHILIVDDDQEITGLLSEYLHRYGYAAHVAADGTSMHQQVSQHAIDLVILDVMLPGADGLTLTREVRQQSQLPIILLTARSSPYDRVLGLEIGADDYVSKPFEPRELVARIQSVLRRSTAPYRRGMVDLEHSAVIRFDGWELHRENRCLHSPDGLVVALSKTEFRLMRAFLNTPRRLLSRDHLMEEALGRNVGALGRNIDLLISRLRQKLAHASDAPDMIRTVRGGGYMLNAQTVEGHATWCN